MTTTMSSMSQQYRKTFLPMQAFILIAGAVLHWYYKVPVVGVLVVLVVMEAFSIVGAWWAARLKRKITGDGDALPLRRRS